MASSGMLRRVALVGTDVPGEISASIIRVARISELGTLAVTSNRLMLRYCYCSHKECYEEPCRLEYNAVNLVESDATFRRNMSPPSSRSKNTLSKK
jgi:hypothetical protein